MFKLVSGQLEQLELATVEAQLLQDKEVLIKLIPPLEAGRAQNRSRPLARREGAATVRVRTKRSEPL